MRFAIVLSTISALLIAIVSAVTIAVLSWIYPSTSGYDRTPISKQPAAEIDVMKL